MSSSNNIEVRVLCDGEMIDRATFDPGYEYTAEEYYGSTVEMYMRLDSWGETTVQYINPDGSIEYERTIEYADAEVSASPRPAPPVCARHRKDV